MSEHNDDALSMDLSEGDLADDIAPDKAVTWGTDWTVTTIIDQLSRGRFDLEPAFQRRDVWSDRKRARFIESLILGIPVPQVILAERPNARGKFIVLDGKQRLRSLQRFAGMDGTPMRLTGLEVLRNLNGKTYDEIREDSALEQSVAALENQAIRAVVLRGWQSESLLYLTFLRLNSNVVGLSPQELRRALHPGPFMEYAMQTSAESSQLKEFLGGARSTKPDFRMRDAEILIRHIALTTRISEYRGNLRRFLDETCEIMNREWDEVSPAVADSAEGLELAMNATNSIFGKHAFRRFSNGRYESRKNRAVLDCMAFHLQDATVRAAALSSPESVRLAFEGACTQEERFQSSLTSTTKTRSAVLTRLGIWGRVLSTVTGVKTVDIPEN
ncbi:DUF262 domain-containing protein [Rhodococcus sp. WB1]|uniref:DUF262 domain-containing protein n=1 Tax=Rhodococcus sp. WB1 TaxID=1033922 RepID=UPI000A002315|nr:DUF262 domain-containing protein [Rhodococcus sp. WB1]